MTAKWGTAANPPLVASNATAGNRLLNVGMAATQLSALSNGELIMLVWDPSLASPNQITLQVTSAHLSPSVIANISQDIFQANTGGFPQSLALCRDAADNIYVIGAYQAGSLGTPYTYQLVAQAFVKGAGLSWTPMASSWTTVASNVSYARGLSAVWCNTEGGPGGTGHILVIANNSDGSTRYQILQAYKLLTGVPTGAATSGGTNPAFLTALGDNMLAGWGSNIDMDANGFGATSGLAISAGNQDYGVGAWGVSPSGVLTGAGMIDASIINAYSSGPFVSASTKAMIVNYNNNRWAAIGMSNQHSGELTVIGFTGSGLAASGLVFNSSVDTGTTAERAILTAANWPTGLSGTLNWGAIAGPPSSNTVWLYAWSTALNTTMLRLPILFTPAGIPSFGAVVTDDTGVGAATNSTIRVADDVTDYLHADWQAYDAVSGPVYSLIGDYSALPAAGLPVTLVSPINNASNPVAGTYTWTYNPAFTGDTQQSYYFRRALQPGGAYQWWTGSAWTSTETAITGSPGQAQFLTFTGSNWVSGDTYSWSVDVTGTSGIRAGYASPQFVGIALPSPANPTLTATYNAALATVALTLHSGDSTGINGSIEYSDDGGVTWNFTINASALTVYPGTASLTDYEMVPGTRFYRARSWTVYPYGYSAYVTQTVTISASAYRLGDPLSQSSTSWMTLQVQAGTFNTEHVENLTVHTPLGRAYPLVMADVIMGEDGGCTVVTTSDVEEAAFLSLVLSQKVLLLISPEGKSWYIRVNTSRAINRPYPGTINREREHPITWNNVTRPIAGT